MLLPVLTGHRLQVSLESVLGSELQRNNDRGQDSDASDLRALWWITQQVVGERLAVLVEQPALERLLERLGDAPHDLHMSFLPRLAHLPHDQPLCELIATDKRDAAGCQMNDTAIGKFNTPVFTKARELRAGTMRMGDGCGRYMSDFL